MKLVTHEYSVNYLSVVLPKELTTTEILRNLQSVAVNEFARLKDGIEVTADNLAELERNDDGDIDKVLVDFVSYLLNNWKHIDTFIFTP